MNWWFDEDIARIARGIERRFRGYVDAEDIRQELILWCLENESTATKLWSAPHWFKSRRLWTIAQRYARTEKARAVGHELDDEWFYSPTLVRSLLPDAFDDDSTPPVSGVEVKVKTATGHGLEWETLMADVRSALEDLGQADFDLLWAVYGERGGTVTGYGNSMGWDYRRTVRAERRAIGRLIDRLGGENPWLEDLAKPPPEPRTATKTTEPIPA